MNKSYILFYAWALGVLLFFFLLGFPPTIATQPDSEGYLRFASDLQTGAIFSQTSAPWYSVIRTPGYPLLIAVGQALLGQNPAAILLVHAALALLVLAVVLIRFQKFVSPWLLIFLTLLSFWLWQDYYEVVLSEWSALCILFLFLSAMPQNYAECSPARMSVLGLMLSALVLVRPAFISCLLVAALVVLLVVRRESRRPVVVGLLCGLLPLFLWCTFNSYRLGTFSMAAFTGHNLFGVASLLGYTNFSRNEWPDLERFSSYVNQHKIPAAGEEAAFVQNLSTYYFNSPYNHNVYQVALAAESARVWPRQYQDELMRRYAQRVLLQNPIAYGKFILLGLTTLTRDVWLMLVAVVMLVMLIRSGHALSLVLGSALATHVFHIALCSAVQVVISRYYLLTLLPLGFCTLLSMLALVKVRR